MEAYKNLNLDDILHLPDTNQGLLLPGATNNTSLISDRQGNLYVRRTTKDNITPLLESTSREYQAIGFFDKGGSYRIRSMLEQFEFIKQCQECELQVVVPVSCDETRMYLPFVVGEPYQAFISTKPESTAKIIRYYLESISQANSTGLVYGDRWGPNTIVDREEQLWHIDFDIQLAGSPAREFEIAQAIYYSLYFAKDKESALLECTNFIDSLYFAIYDLGLVLDFLKGHIRYFQNGNYGGIQTEISRMTHAA